MKGVTNKNNVTTYLSVLSQELLDLRRRTEDLFGLLFDFSEKDSINKFGTVLPAHGKAHRV